jgi:hypothetical protein
MRSNHIIVIATVVAVCFGVKLVFFSAPTAEANVQAGKSLGMHESKVPVSAMLPMRRVHNMTFVFADGD